MALPKGVAIELTTDAAKAFSSKKNDNAEKKDKKQDKKQDKKYDKKKDNNAEKGSSFLPSFSALNAQANSNLPNVSAKADSKQSTVTADSKQSTATKVEGSENAEKPLCGPRYVRRRGFVKKQKRLGYEYREDEWPFLSKGNV